LKIGIITILKVNNYGAELQAFALQKKLEYLGFESEIIDYLYYKNSNFIYTSMAKPFVKLSLLTKVKEWLNPIRENILTFPYRTAENIRMEKFENFHKNNTKLSLKTYRSIDELYQSKFNYDIFMVGSDQVWNPQTNVSLKPYFLTFAPKGKLKVSYASSFGVSSIPGMAKEIYKQGLNNIDQIAVREKQGVKLVKELTGRTACHVLDPTLLLNKQEWESVATLPKFTEPYILLYELSESAYTTQLAKTIAVNLGWTVVRVCKNAVEQDNDPSIHNIIDAGPSEYIGLFLNAAFVITNSFHGTAFSINFCKPFYSILSKEKPNNSRQEGLLSLLNLEKRLVNEGTPLPEPGDYFLDFAEPSILLANERKKSIRYLMDTTSEK